MSLTGDVEDDECDLGEKKKVRSVAPPYIPLPYHGEHRRAVSAVAFAGSGVGGGRSAWSAASNKTAFGGKSSKAVTSKTQAKGAFVASASADATVKIWDIRPDMITGARQSYSTNKQKSATKKCDDVTSALLESSVSMSPVMTLVGHSRGINDVAWSCHRQYGRPIDENSPPPPYIATASDDKTLRLWDVETGDALVEFRGHANFVFSVRFNPPSSNLLVSGSFDETVKLWDVRSGVCVSTLPAHSDPVTGVDFNRDGTCIVSGSHDGLIRIWDTATGECLKTLYAEGNHPPVSYVGYSPNGRFVLAGTLDSKLRLWDVTKKYHPFSSSSFLTGSGLPLTGASSTDINTYRKPTTLRCAKTYAGGHVSSKFCSFAAFAVAGPKDRQYVVSGSEDGTVYLYNLNSQKAVQKLDGHYRHFIRNSASQEKEKQADHQNSSGERPDKPEGKSTTAEGEDQTLPPQNDRGPVLAVAAHPKQEMIASGGMGLDKTVRIWVPAYTDDDMSVDEAKGETSSEVANKRQRYDEEDKIPR